MNDPILLLYAPAVFVLGMWVGRRYPAVPRWMWRQIWRFYDSPRGAWLPHSIAPWLLGKVLGSKGRRVRDIEEIGGLDS
jgi:hypothetical protein